LLQLLRAQGFHKVCALITVPNPASIALHERLGFNRVGVYTSIGYKLSAWRDVAHYQLDLRAAAGAPAQVRTPLELCGTPEWSEALAAGLALLSVK
jgi:phosphinothricin acetyltransferase